MLKRWDEEPNFYKENIRFKRVKTNSKSYTYLHQYNDGDFNFKGENSFLFLRKISKSVLFYHAH